MSGARPGIGFAAELTAVIILALIFLFIGEVFGLTAMIATIGALLYSGVVS